ncbi:hypothetical protein A4S06_11615 [Erysipelotrichaceae bacterium MTC7]|nr:hypothetical protein A4S06_11615 [Erysipelotrichaceae bacterium MTC7]
MKIDRELKNKIKDQIQIVDIAEEFGLRVVHKSKRLAKLEEHDSVTIYKDTNSFVRWATHKGGDVLKFMEEIPEIDMNFKEAYEYCLPRINVDVDVIEKKPRKTLEDTNSLAYKKKRTQTLLGNVTFDESSKNVMAYLIQKRKIDPTIVITLVKQDFIKQAQDRFGRKSVAFVGRDELGLVACVNIRSCTDANNFKLEIQGSDYNYGWLVDMSVDPRQNAYNEKPYSSKKELLCFEGAVDMLSYMTLQKEKGIDLNDYAYLATGSCTRYETILKVQERIGYESITVCYDNDWGNKINAGKKFAGIAIEILSSKGVNAKELYPLDGSKDWNEFLVKKTESSSIDSIRNTIDKAKVTQNKKCKCKKNRTPNKVNIKGGSSSTSIILIYK